MNKKLTFLLVLLIYGHTSVGQDLTTFILVRHAEKADDGTRNPPLTEEGKLRAQYLSTLLRDQSISGLYSTPYKRTEETLKHIADQKSLVIQSYNPLESNEWLEGLIKKHEGNTIVISGHSNTIPTLANALLGRETFTQFDESDYANLILIVTSSVGKGKLIHLKI